MEIKLIINGVESNLADIDETEMFIEGIEFFETDLADTEIVNFRVEFKDPLTAMEDYTEKFAISASNFCEMFDNWIDSEEETQKKIDAFLELIEEEFTWSYKVNKVVVLGNGSLSDWDITNLFTRFQ